MQSSLFDGGWVAELVPYIVYTNYVCALSVTARHVVARDADVFGRRG